MNKWAYGFALNHEGAGVGTIYYAAEYFDKDGIVNPASAEAYTTAEIDVIKNGATEGSQNYLFDVPEGALVGMNVLGSDKIYWYDCENSAKILASAAPLILDAASGEMKDGGGNTAATPIA